MDVRITMSIPYQMFANIGGRIALDEVMAMKLPETRISRHMITLVVRHVCGGCGG